MITAVRIKNLRSLADTGFIEIKPITLLLGANSTGKSTFLRSFPLFTQSVSKNLRGPVLWYDESLVDFGDYDTAKNKYAGENETIEFSYKICEPVYGWPRKPIRKYHDLLLMDGLLREAILSFRLKNDEKGTYINSLKIELDGIDLKIDTPKREGKLRFAVNGQPLETILPVIWDSTTYDNILPRFEYDTKKYEDTKEGELPSRHPLILSRVINFINKRCINGKKNGKQAVNIYQNWVKDKERYLNWLQTKSPLEPFKEYVRNWTIDDKEFTELYNLIAVARMIPVIETAEEELLAFYGGCSYIAPTRAGANRYYRIQELQVSDIDPYGKNLSEFVGSLPSKMLESYHQFTMKILGVEVKTKASTGLQSIILANKKEEFNISDVGFGYSQILPIITKLWHASNRSAFKGTGIAANREFVDSVILIEQPELHLHPAYQAKIADAFINTMNANQNRDYVMSDVRMVAETHSDTILNRIGRRVREGAVHPRDVNIVLFEKKPGEPTTQVKQTTYNEKGQIKEWPYGFFDPDED